MHFDSINEIQVLITISVSLFEQRAKEFKSLKKANLQMIFFLFSFLELEYWMNGKADRKGKNINKQMETENGC